MLASRRNNFGRNIEVAVCCYLLGVSAPRDKLGIQAQMFGLPLARVGLLPLGIQTHGVAEVVVQGARFGHKDFPRSLSEDAGSRPLVMYRQASCII
jgi:hypothetical protein